MGVMNEDRLTLYDGLIKTHITNTTVAKEDGKGLSTEDYTTEEKNIVSKLGESADNNLTFNGKKISAAQMTGATADTDGTSGMVPAPTVGQENHVLKGNGKWEALAYDSELSAESENAPQTKVVEAKAKEIETSLSQLSNPNLLLNPDFKVNTRGQSSYTNNIAWAYNLDNWMFHPFTVTTVKSSCISITHTPSADYPQYRMYLSQFYNISDFHKGKTMTLSTKMSGNNFSVVVNAHHTDDTETTIINKPYSQYDGVIQFNFDVPNTDTINKLNIFIVNNYENGVSETINIAWVKLELGSIATPFVPPNHDVELYKCLGASGIYSNPNLLINPDFKINQRGGSEYQTIGGFTVDRWRHIGRETIIITPQETGLHIKDTSGLDTNLIEQVFDDFSVLVGKTVTLSVSFSNKTGDMMQFGVFRDNGSVATVRAYEETREGVLSVTGIIPSDITRLSIACTKYGTSTNFSVDINWVKLELGSIATPFVPRLYGEELALCQRYGFECGIDDATQGYPLTVQAATSNVAYGLLPIPVTMRTTPTISKQTLLYCFGTFNTGFSNTVQVHLSVMGFSNNTIQIAATIDDNLFIPGNVYTLYFPSSPKSLFFDAEIY